MFDGSWIMLIKKFATFTFKLNSWLKSANIYDFNTYIHNWSLQPFSQIFTNVFN